MTTSEPEQSVSDLEPLPRLQLREKLPAVTDSTEALHAVSEAVASGSGPVALDAERASGYRYSQRAYLVQLRREGLGTALIDPIAFEDLASLDRAIGDSEWILHAATQDLPCLAEVGMHPRRLFDTELAGRLLNLPKVGLAALVERYLGYSLAKEHSAADWSTRPLEPSWLEYAALDVEVLVELRDAIERDLIDAGKLEWARQDFEALLNFSGPPVRKDPWRRTSGFHKVRGRRSLAIVRSLWEARDAIAAERDTAPGRILSDASIIQLANNPTPDKNALKDMSIIRHRGAHRFVAQWQRAIDDALALDDAELPRNAPRSEGPPPPRSWTDKRPEAALRLGRFREVIVALAAEHEVPSENLISPGIIRALAWEPPEPADIAGVSDRLRELGARSWQIEIIVGDLTAAMS